MLLYSLIQPQWRREYSEMDGRGSTTTWALTTIALVLPITQYPFQSSNNRQWLGCPEDLRQVLLTFCFVFRRVGFGWGKEAAPRLFKGKGVWMEEG